MGLVNVAVLSGLVLGVGVAAFLLARLLQYREVAVPREDFDISRYAPMAHLLNKEEVAFLAAQPGSTPKQIREFRNARRRIFRGYLRELSADFRALHAEARHLVAVSPEKSSELVEMLLRQQVSFWGAILRLETQLALDAVGIGQVNPGRLLEGVEELHAALARAASGPGPFMVR